jgi:excisionase family DNA binding protein
LLIGLRKTSWTIKRNYRASFSPRRFGKIENLPRSFATLAWTLPSLPVTGAPKTRTFAWLADKSHLAQRLNVASNTWLAERPRVVCNSRQSKVIMSTNFQSNTSVKRPQLMRVPEVAQLLNVKPRTIYEMVAQDRIPYRKPPGTNILRFDLEEIMAWTKSRANT